MDHISRVGMFLAVIKHGSFAGAARSLGLTGPALSKQVQALENQLGVQLIHRTTRQLRLTEEGLLYSERAGRALEDLHEAEQDIQALKTNPTGLLRINGPMSFGSQFLAKPLAAFAKHYPDIQLDVDFDDRKVDMLAEGYDVVVRIGALEDSSMIARHLSPCPIILCASPSHLAQHGTPASPDALVDHPAIIYTKHGKQHSWHYKQTKGSTGKVRLQETLNANSAEMQRQACLQGIGISLLPIFCIFEDLKSGKLKQILPDYQTNPPRTIAALYPEKRHLPHKTRLLLDWLESACGQFPWKS